MCDMAEFESGGQKEKITQHIFRWAGSQAAKPAKAASLLVSHASWRQPSYEVMSVVWSKDRNYFFCGITWKISWVIVHHNIETKPHLGGYSSVLVLYVRYGRVRHAAMANFGQAQPAIFFLAGLFISYACFMKKAALMLWCPPVGPFSFFGELLMWWWMNFRLCRLPGSSFFLWEAADMMDDNINVTWCPSGSFFFFWKAADDVMMMTCHIIPFIWKSIKPLAVKLLPQLWV